MTTEHQGPVEAGERCQHADFWYDGTEYVCYICDKRWPAPFPPELPVPPSPEGERCAYVEPGGRRCVYAREVHPVTVFPSLEVHEFTLAPPEGERCTCKEGVLDVNCPVHAADDVPEGERPQADPASECVCKHRAHTHINYEGACDIRACKCKRFEPAASSSGDGLSELWAQYDNAMWSGTPIESDIDDARTAVEAAIRAPLERELEEARTLLSARASAMQTVHEIASRNFARAEAAEAALAEARAHIKDWKSLHRDAIESAKQWRRANNRAEERNRQMAEAIEKAMDEIAVGLGDRASETLGRVLAGESDSADG